MKLRVKTQQITEFVENANAIINQKTLKGKRSKYTSCLQLMVDALDPKYKSIHRHFQAIREKHALVNTASDQKEFMLGANQSYTYNKEGAKLMQDELQEYLEKWHELSLEVPYFKLSVADLPVEAGEVSVSNQIIKILSPFVISKELHDELLYGEYKDAEKEELEVGHNISEEEEEEEASYPRGERAPVIPIKGTKKRN